MDDSAEHLQNHADETEAALAAAQKILRTAGIVEIAARNPQVMEYMQHWETRAEKAEAERAALGRKLNAALYGEPHFGVQALEARIEALEAEREALREALSLIAVVGYSSDPEVNAAIARQVVDSARAALNREKSDE